MTNRQLTRKVKKMEDEVELKYKDTAYNIGQVEATAFKPYNIGLIGQGVDERARIGDFIRHTSLKMRFWIRFEPNNTVATTAFVRVLLCYDSQPTQTTSSLGQPPVDLITGSILGQSLLDTSEINPLLQHYDVQTCAMRYRVLYDKVFTLQSRQNDTATDPPGPAPVSMFLKKKIKLGRKAVYNGNGAVYEQLTTNALYFAVYFYAPESNEADQDQLICTGNIRLYYKDL